MRPGVAPGGSHTAWSTGRPREPALRCIAWGGGESAWVPTSWQPQGWRSTEVIKEAGGKSTITLALSAQLLLPLDFWSRDTNVSFSKIVTIYIQEQKTDTLHYHSWGSELLCLIPNLYVSPYNILATSVPFLRLQEQSAPDREALKSSSVFSHSSGGREFKMSVMSRITLLQKAQGEVCGSLTPASALLFTWLSSLCSCVIPWQSLLSVCIQIFFFPLMKIVILLD